MLGNAAYFIFSSDDRTDLPPVVMVAGGTVCASVLLIAVALVGLLPVAISTAPVTYAGFEVAWWVPLVALGVVASAASYLLGITGARLLGTRLASFVGLSEVLIAIILASVLVGQVLTGSQWLGGFCWYWPGWCWSSSAKAAHRPTTDRCPDAAGHRATAGGRAAGGRCRRPDQVAPQIGITKAPSEKLIGWVNSWWSTWACQQRSW